jgi:hypothetical protein
MNQQNSRWGDQCLDAFLDMFATNITLLKVESAPAPPPFPATSVNIRRPLWRRNAGVFCQSFVSSVCPADKLATAVTQVVCTKQNDHSQQRDRPPQEEQPLLPGPPAHRPQVGVSGTTRGCGRQQGECQFGDDRCCAHSSAALAPGRRQVFVAAGCVARPDARSGRRGFPGAGKSWLDISGLVYSGGCGCRRCAELGSFCASRHSPCAGSCKRSTSRSARSRADVPGSADRGGLAARAG